MVSCGNVNCSCLELLKENDKVRAIVAKYLTGFERKSCATRIVLSWIGTGLLKQDLGADKYGTACRTMEPCARTQGVYSMQHKLISCV